MKSEVRIEELNLVGLMKASLNNNEIMTYPYSVHWGNLINGTEFKFLNCPENEDAAMDENFKLEYTLEYLKEDENNYVYVNFSTSCVGDPIACIDGNSYGNDYFDEDEEEDEEDTGAEMLDESSSFGYIIQYKDGLYLISSRIFSMTTIKCSVPPTEVVQFVDDCLEFEEPLTKYLDRFIS